MLARFEMASPLVDRVAKTMLAIGLCLIAINLIGLATKTGFEMVETARIGSISGDESAKQLVGEKRVIEKRFSFQGPHDELNLDNLSNINLSFNPNNNNLFNGNNRKIRHEDAPRNHSDDDDDDEEDDEDDDDDEDGSVRANKSAKVENQRPISAGDLSGTQQVLAAAANRSEQTGVLLPAPVVVQQPESTNKKPDEGIRPRLFKLGLLIG